MSDNDGDTKPENPVITVRVRDQSGEETFFKIKRSTKLAKVFESYSIKKGVQSSSLRFMLDGERVDGEQTAADLDLEDQDQIDCLLEQTGGF